MTWADPVTAFRDIAAGHERMFWLDGGGSRDWSGRRSILGWLEDDDVSLTYDAARREVWEVRDGDRRLVGDDIFTVLAEEVARDGGDSEVSWVGWFGYACRPDLPATPGGGVPAAVWMCSQRRLVFDHEPPPNGRGGERAPERAPAPTTAGSTAVSRSSYDGWFVRVQEQLRLGNTYEVNLTYRESVPSTTPPTSSTRGSAS